MISKRTLATFSCSKPKVFPQEVWDICLSIYDQTFTTCFGLNIVEYEIYYNTYQKLGTMSSKELLNLSVTQQYSLSYHVNKFQTEDPESFLFQNVNFIAQIKLIVTVEWFRVWKFRQESGMALNYSVFVNFVYGLYQYALFLDQDYVDLMVKSYHRQAFDEQFF